MAKSLNHVYLMGNLTKDPELRSTPNGQDVAAFSLALNRSYKDTSGSWQEATDYVDILAWGKLAEQVTTRLTKGSGCLVQGRIQTRVWEKDGKKLSRMEILATDITFLDRTEH